jgi:hypothetical protein
MQIRYAGGCTAHSQHGDMQLRHVVGLTGALSAPEGNNNTGIMRTRDNENAAGKTCDISTSTQSWVQ